MAETRLKIAVFIDFDNIEIGVKTTLGGHFDVGAVLEAIKERGEVVTKIAYGDWTRAGDYSRSLTQHAIHMVQRNLTPGGDKNGADINLALDALEMAFTHSHINAFVIVGGDSDFMALVEKLKQYDRKVFVVGGRAFTSVILQRNCTEFIAYENLVGATARKAGGRAGKAGEAPALQAVPLIRRALKVLADREVSPQLGVLKSTLLQLDSTFSEREYGASTFRDFVQRLARAGYLTLKGTDRNIYVELREGLDGAAASLPASASGAGSSGASGLAAAPGAGAGRDSDLTAGTGAPTGGVAGGSSSGSIGQGRDGELAAAAESADVLPLVEGEVVAGAGASAGTDASEGLDGEVERMPAAAAADHDLDIDGPQPGNSIDDPIPPTYGTRYNTRRGDVGRHGPRGGAARFEPRGLEPRGGDARPAEGRGVEARPAEPRAEGVPEGGRGDARRDRDGVPAGASAAQAGGGGGRRETPHGADVNTSAGMPADAVRFIGDVFQRPGVVSRWPLYLRQVKQILRGVDENFDERRYGFTGIVEALRSCQRDGLFRLDRDRQGVLRVYPGPNLQRAAAASTGGDAEGLHGEAAPAHAGAAHTGRDDEETAKVPEPMELFPAAEEAGTHAAPVTPKRVFDRDEKPASDAAGDGAAHAGAVDGETLTAEAEPVTVVEIDADAAPAAPAKPARGARKASKATKATKAARPAKQAAPKKAAAAAAKPKAAKTTRGGRKAAK